MSSFAPNGLNESEKTIIRSFPETLSGFGYKFTDGKIRDIRTGEPFKFEVYESPYLNQQRYEAMGEIVTKHVFDLLLSEGKLQTLEVPFDSFQSGIQSFIFQSPDAFEAEKVIVLIHGSGVVRAGQWARSLIMNDCLDTGTQLPFIKKAKDSGYGVFVLNTNDNERLVDGKLKEIKGSETAEKHACHVWDKFISKAAAKRIAIIAHSYGGIVTVNLCNTFPNSCQNKIFAIALTDSVHSLASQGTPSDRFKWFKEVGRNWVSSHDPLDTPIPRCNKAEIENVSAGHSRHDMTSSSSIESIFKFIEERLKSVTEENPRSKDNEEL